MASSEKAKRNLNQGLCSNKRIKSSENDLINSLPTEILLYIFKKLDAKSVLGCSSVCKRWNNIMKTFFPDSSWETISKAEIEPTVLEEILTKVSPSSGSISWSQLYRCWYVSSKSPNKWQIEDIELVKEINNVHMLNILNGNLIILTLDNEIKLHSLETRDLLSCHQCEFRVNTFHIVKIDNIFHIIILGTDITYLGVLFIEDNKFINYTKLQYNATLEPILNLAVCQEGQIAFFTNLSYVVHAKLSYSPISNYTFNITREIFTLNYCKLYFWDQILVKLDSFSLIVYSLEDGNINIVKTFDLPKYFIAVNGLIKSNHDILIAYDYYTLFKFTKSNGVYVLNSWTYYNTFSFKMISFNMFSNMFVLLKPKLKRLVFKFGDIDSIVDYFNNEINKSDLFRDFFFYKF